MDNVMTYTQAERISALHGHYHPGRHGAIGKVGIQFELLPDLILHQIAYWPNTVELVDAIAADAAGVKTTPSPCRSATGESGTLLRIEPLKYWLLDHPAPTLTPDQGSTQDLSHSRTRIRITGPDTTALLNQLVPLDLRPQSFPQSSVASSAIHHVGVTLWHSEQGYELFIPRGFALSIWKVLVESALQFGIEVF